jgi:PBSX family phage portal protein
MAIKKRVSGSIDTSTIRPTARVRRLSKTVIDYSGGYLELLTKAQSSNQLADPFANSYGGASKLSPVEPIYDFSTLLKIFIESTILRQCIEAYIVNIESYGYVLDYIGPAKQKESKAAKEEYRRLSSFIDHCSGSGLNLTEIRSNARSDYEVVGNRAFEVSRNQKGEIIMFDHVPASTIRLTKRDTDPVEIIYEIPDPLNEGKTKKQTAYRHFRRFVQKDSLGRSRYFKEFGDPRNIDPDTGHENNSLAVEDTATEILYDSQYVPGQVYGLPKWIGQIPAVLGSKESELVNLNFFRDNAIPAMAVMVSNGALTKESFDKLQEYFLSIKGQKSMNRIVVLEAVPDDTYAKMDHSQPAPRVDIKPLISERQQEGLFQEYDQNNLQKVRSCFRLPPIFVGRAEDYTRASAVASMLTAENQIFAPERIKFDLLMNTKILSTYKPKFWRFKSVGAPITDGETLTKMLKTLGELGALSANTVIRIANQFLDTDIEAVSEDWGNAPFDVVLAMVKAGDQIKGLDTFVSKVRDASNTTLPQTNESDKAIKAIVKREFKELAEELTEAVHEGLQTLATNK